MYPYIVIGNGSIPTYSLCVIVGILIFVFVTMFKLRKSKDFTAEVVFILPRQFISIIIGYFGAVFFDALVNIPKNGGLKLEGTTFMGGMIPAITFMYASLNFFRKKTQYSVGEWLDILTVPFIIFHSVGRLGCFFGGCCYGKVTDGAFGILFPDNPEMGIYHNGAKVLPTQLFESAGLALIALGIHFIKKDKLFYYALLYPVLRFSLEFLRNDNRGAFIGALSPSQFLSVLIFAGAIVWFTVTRILMYLRKKRGAAPPDKQDDVPLSGAESSEDAPA